MSIPSLDLLQPRPDALHAGACLAAGAQAFLTNDRQLLRLGDRLDVIVLEDWIGEIDG